MCKNTEIEALPANEGDCILVTIEQESLHILIDGGTAETYRNYLKNRLGQFTRNYTQTTKRGLLTTNKG